MDFKNIIGQEKVKTFLDKTITTGRIPHAQLFVGQEGVGMLPMAIAYAQKLICKEEICARLVAKLEHPDLHFAFPTTSTSEIKSNPESDLFLNTWRSFVLKNPYGNYLDWMETMGVANKQGIIPVRESEKIIKKVSLKAFEGGYKIMIIWMAEKMNQETANKLLKIIEEPPQKTVFILITSQEERILDTIKSRCQAVYFDKLSKSEIASTLIAKHQVKSERALQLALQANGSYNKALKLIEHDEQQKQYQEWFVTWVRAAFLVKSKVAALTELVNWSEHIATQGREAQKSFLNYCLQLFRQALLTNYKAKEITYLNLDEIGFSLDKFAPYVHGNNIAAINKEINEAIYHIERNGNAKIILLDVSLKLTRLIHSKP
jgi:DNA polymerase-3 subunit delta'